VTRDEVLDLLKQVHYPGLNRDLVSFGMVKDVEVLPEGVDVHLEVASKDPAIPGRLDEAVRAVLESRIHGRLQVFTRLTGGHGESENHDHHGHGHGHGHGAPDPNTMPKLLEQVKHVVAVASGKGGVGKSAVASNLAVALAAAGYRTGLLDADIYGPSVQLIMGSMERPFVQDNKIIPLEAHGVHMLSIGHLIEEDAAMIWRGPMVMQALTQLMQDVLWPELDFLVVDMPPGTGDAQLTMAQRVRLSGAVVVTTPQEVALIDARKAVTMFRKVGVPILGIVENMSWFQCPDTGKRHFIFGEGGGAREAERQQVPLLAELPIDIRIREGGDRGQPIVSQDPAYAEIFDNLVQAICRQLA
jgi:ATP-binding protein involved in chromosome partitioning